MRKKEITSLSLENTQFVLKSLEETGEFTALTRGISMRPLLRQEREIVFVEKVDRPLEKGDVPLYKRPNYDYLLLHRILKVRDNDYIIRGDNTYKLEYVPKDFVVGVLKGIFRNGKYIDCKTSKKYKFYIFINRISYPLRYVWAVLIRPSLSKIKRAIFKQKNRQ